MGDSNPLATFGYLAEQLGRRGIAFLFLRESLAEPRLGPALKARFGGAVIANEGFTAETARKVLQAGEADAVSFGKDFLANPDLPARLAKGLPLNPWQMKTFYGAGLPDPRVGYTDYPALA